MTCQWAGSCAGDHCGERGGCIADRERKIARVGGAWERMYERPLGEPLWVSVICRWYTNLYSWGRRGGGQDWTHV